MYLAHVAMYIHITNQLRMMPPQCTVYVHMAAWYIIHSTRPGPKTRHWKEILSHIFFISLSLVIEVISASKGLRISGIVSKSCPILVNGARESKPFQYCVIFTSFTHPNIDLIYFLFSLDFPLLPVHTYTEWRP